MREFDYVIVGAGAAGAVIAARLTEDPAIRVLLLEAGPTDHHILLRMPLGAHSSRYPDTLWKYETEPEPGIGGRRLSIPRGKVLGGSSTVNAMLYSRGHPRDYDQWRQMGCDGWGFADVLPYFKRSERSWRGESLYHGGGGELRVSAIPSRWNYHREVMAAVRTLGLPTTEDHHGENPEGFGFGETTTGRGRRSSSSRAFLHPIMHRRNLTIVTEALATHILFEAKRAVGVEYERRGRSDVARASEVILAGGTYNSPQLLMLSGIGPAEELRAHGIPLVADAPNLGGNLSEHCSIFLACDATDSLISQLRFDKVAISLAAWWVLRSGAFAHQATSAHALLRTRPELERPDVQLFYNPARVDSRPWFPLLAPRLPHEISCLVVLLHPQSRGRLTLRSSDPRDPPRILLNVLQERGDVETLIAGIRLARGPFQTPPLSDLIIRERMPGPLAQSDAELEAYIRANLVVSHHPVGTCAMGPDASSVVDPQLRVRGVEALRVCDASIMPTVPGGNTNAPSTMIGEKAADLIRGRTLAPAPV
ncbi:MAG: GMC family oxidoreductase N-terminal domain-containing protein [Hyphomonadaceae bacterium]|nr:GMC family oxidoreductase N-terminal domain-containing protein [Hyphomonadaceae bacterium]